MKNRNELNAAFAAQLVATFELSEHLAMLDDFAENCVLYKDVTATDTPTGNYTPDFDGVDLLIANCGGNDITLKTPSNLNNGEIKYIYFSNFNSLKLDTILGGDTRGFGNVSAQVNTLIMCGKKNNALFFKCMWDHYSQARTPSGAFDFIDLIDTHFQYNVAKEASILLELSLTSSIANGPSGLVKTNDCKLIVRTTYTSNVLEVELIEMAASNHLIKYVGKYIAGSPSAIYWGQAFDVAMT